jgi:hypothetical protein
MAVDGASTDTPVGRSRRSARQARQRRRSRRRPRAPERDYAPRRRAAAGRVEPSHTPRE